MFIKMLTILIATFLIFFANNLKAQEKSDQFAVCHSQLDEHFDVFFHIFLKPNSQIPTEASVLVDVYKDLNFSKPHSVRFLSTQSKWTYMPEVSFIASADGKLRLEWFRESKASKFSEVKKIRWISPLSDKYNYVLQVVCSQLDEL